MLNCKECLKNDVCKNKEEIDRLHKCVQLNHEYQLLTLMVNVDVNCPNFYRKERVIRGKCAL